ncbi:MAG: methionine adenosyltransferase [Gammaproteobacteria bacterium]|nr:methionine adenosyltransferase [Gammaproteobacteria bacterium]
MTNPFIFTSESVTRGHPDKLCDQVSDAIIDHFLVQDPHARVVAECAVSSGVLFVSTHFASTASMMDISEIARRTIDDIGYPKEVFNAKDCTILSSIMDHTQEDYDPLELESLNDMAIDKITARQQASVFGYACDQTEDLMPVPIWLAHRMAARIDSVHGHKKKLSYLLPDAEVQVGFEFNDGKPSRLHSIAVVTTQTENSTVELEQLREDINHKVIHHVLKKEKIAHDDTTQVHINPRGARRGGGPAVHSGLTGRKSSIDTYGGFARFSGTALSGKDPMRIDRVGAYIARFAAKNVVAAGLARECEVQLSYTIGQASPVSLRVRTFGSGELDDQVIADRLREVIDFRVGAIVRDLKLKTLSNQPGGFYNKLAVYGHMGRRKLDVPWEKTNLTAQLK